MTKEVLAECQKLETNIDGLQKKVKKGLSHIDVLQQEQRVLSTLQSEIAETKQKHTYTVNVAKSRRINLKGSGIYVTNCLHCNFTCHYIPAAFPMMQMSINVLLWIMVVLTMLSVWFVQVVVTGKNGMRRRWKARPRKRT